MLGKIIPTGFDLLDKNLGGGLRSAGIYYLASEQKAGKSSFVRKLVYNLCSKNEKVCMIDIEEARSDILQVMAALRNEVKSDDVTQEQVDEVERFLMPNLKLVDCTQSEEWQVDGVFDVGKAIGIFKRAKDLECKVFVFDNVTRTASERSDKGYQLRIQFIAELVKFCRQNQVCVVALGHIKSQELDYLSKGELNEAIKEKKFDDLVTKSLTAIRKPDINDLWGGSILTQFDVILKLWRPFQRWDEKVYQQVCYLLCEETRRTAPFHLRMIFDGAKKNFTEYGGAEDFAKKFGTDAMRDLDGQV